MRYARTKEQLIWPLLVGKALTPRLEKFSVGELAEKWSTSSAFKQNGVLKMLVLFTA